MNASDTNANASAEPPVLAVTGLRKAFRLPCSSGEGAVHAVAGVDLLMGRGEIVGLVGESGSGKTTVAHCVLRLLEPDAGAIALDGADITHLSRRKLMPLRPKMHMVFQDPYSSLNPRMKVADIVAAPLRAQRRVRPMSRQKLPHRSGRDAGPGRALCAAARQVPA